MPPRSEAPPTHDQEEATGSGAKLLREVLWQRLDVPGIEYFRLWEGPAGPRLAGTVILAHAGGPVRLKYGVACAPDWTTRGVHVVLTRGGTTRHLKLVVDDRQRWWQGSEEVPRRGAGDPRTPAVQAADDAAGPLGAAGPPGAPRAVELPEVAGCLDVDLAFTPATNLLPLRRLGLAVGEGRDATAAWVRFPELDIQPLPQRYTRLAERLVRYESRGGAFTADLEVDELGLVMRYPPLWELVAGGDQAQARRP
jgi:hypothetical protein